jgi:hypothetical protein
MKTWIIELSMIVLVGVSLLVMLAFPMYGEGPPRTLLMKASYHRTQAATYHRQEAVQLGQAIQRYEIMARVYQNGSERSVGTVNPQGRRVMVERTKRVIAYFLQKKQEIEQRAADHEALAQSLPES